MRTAYLIVASIIALFLAFLLVTGWGWDPMWREHGCCFLFSPVVLATTVTGNTLTGIAYVLLLPVMLLALGQVQDWRSREIIYLFAAFIFLCGGGHFIDIWNIWHSRYALQGVWSLATGAVSVWTFIRLVSFVKLAYRKRSEDRQTVRSAINSLRESDTTAEIRAISDRLQTLYLLGEAQ